MQVIRRHENLKAEMLNLPNNVNLMTGRWSRLYETCGMLMRTQRVRELVGNGNGLGIYGINPGDPITLEHLVALKIYTDFTELNQLFCEHFRRKKLSGNIFESTRSVGARNGKFWNLAKLLKEAVQCFGTFFSQNTILYRGVDKQFIFPSFVPRYHTPLSTSKSVCFHLPKLPLKSNFRLNPGDQRSAAINFAANGTLLALTGYNSPIFGLDVQWIAAYTEESEVILFGGDCILQIDQIYLFENEKWNRFQNEIRAIQSIRGLVRGLSLDTLTDEHVVKSLIFTLIGSLLNRTVGDVIPSRYIHKLLMYQIANTPRCIVFDYDILLEDYKFLHRIIKKDGPDDLLHIDKLCCLFPNSDQVIFRMADSCEIRSIFWNSVCEDILRIDRSVTVSFQWTAMGMALISWECGALRYCQNVQNELRMEFLIDSATITISRISRNDKADNFENDILGDNDHFDILCDFKLFDVCK